MTQVQIIFQVQERGIYSIMFHLTVLSAVQVMYQASGTADSIYQTEQLQKL